MPNTSLTISTSPGKHDGQSVFTLTGPLTMATLSEFQDVVRAETARVVIIDLTGVPYMDSAGLGAIINAHVSCTKNERRLALAGVPERIRTLLRLTGVEKVLTIFPTAQEAQENLAS
jgi:anti-sigma B factor antagonist